jgi:hypothetical protein
MIDDTEIEVTLCPHKNGRNMLGFKFKGRYRFYMIRDRSLTDLLKIVKYYIDHKGKGNTLENYQQYTEEDLSSIIFLPINEFKLLYGDI